MNEIFENDSVITRAHNFYNTYKALIIGIAVIVLTTISVFFVLNQISKSNNENAAEIYNNWTLQEIETDDGKKISTDLFNELIDSYKKTGYTKLALLNHQHAVSDHVLWMGSILVVILLTLLIQAEEPIWARSLLISQAIVWIGLAWLSVQRNSPH